MTIVVNTPTGNIGKRITERLLAAGADLILLTRNPCKLDAAVRNQAIIYQGSLEDAEFVQQTTAGAEALLWITPTNLAAPDQRAWYQHFGQVAANAVQTNRIPYVVNISSRDAHVGEGVGIISRLHDVEQALSQAADNILHLRCGFFMENYINLALETIRTVGKIFLPVPGDARYPMVATRDIADVAADRLLNKAWSGHCIQELHGPVDLSFDEAAAVLSQALAKPVDHVFISPEQARANLVTRGASQDFANQFVEMYGMWNREIVPGEPRTLETTTPTTLFEWATEVMLPRLSMQTASNPIAK